MSLSRFVFLIFFGFAVVVCVSAANRACAETNDTIDPSRAVTLHDASFVMSDSPTPPPTGWQAVTLPDVWRIRHPGQSGFAWYRIAFNPRSVPTQPLALYVPHVSLVATFWLNGSLLNPGVVFDRSDGRMGTQMSETPIYLVLPSGLFHTGENVLDIRLQGDRRIRSGLSAPMLGSTVDLEPRWAWRNALQVTVPNVVLVVVVSALCFVVVHLQRKGGAHLIQLGMLAGIGTAILYLAVKLPMGRETEQLLRIVANIVEHWALVVIGYRMSGARQKWFPPLWHTVTVLTTIVVFWYAATDTITDRTWLLTWPHLLLRFVVVYLLLQRAWRDRSFKLAVIAITSGIWLLSLVQSYVLLTEAMPWDQFRSSSLGIAPFCAVMLFVFAEQFILDRQQAALAQQHAITSERSRILQDMHDGMGAHLVAALHLARRGDVARHELIDSIEASLHDLRSIIDSLDVADDDLLPLLANLRFRVEPRLNALGIALAWDIATPFPELTGLTPQTALSVLRIVQESINNIIQHAKARVIRLVAQAEGSTLCIRISDDGCGFDASNASLARNGGHGLAGMHARAEGLKGSVRILSGTEGTTVELRIPLMQGSAGDATPDRFVANGTA